MKSLDAFGRPVQEFQVKTTCGGYLSVCSFCLITILFLTELRYFLALETKDQMLIDQDQDRKYLDIVLNVTFPNVPCSVLQMNLIDPKKSNVMHVVHEVYKTRLRPGWTKGSPMVPIGSKIRDSLTNVAQSAQDLVDALYGDGHNKQNPKIDHATTHLRCSSCFQSHQDEDDCCDSCSDVRAAFTQKGLDQPTNYVFGQCAEEAYQAAPAIQAEGCHIDATLHVRKVAATIHIGVGRYLKSQHIPENDLQEYLTSLDFTHEIEHISFGQDFPGLVHVLDGRSKSHHQHPNSEHFQYDIHVIPTRFKEDGRSEVNSHQYSVTEYVKSINTRQQRHEMVAVGIWANYDFTPFEVKVTRSRKPFSHFFTECCAILGGVFALTGMIDNFAYALNKSVGRRGRNKGGASALTAVGPEG
jgi:hypothetical protein